MNAHLVCTVIGFHLLVVLFPVTIFVLWKWPATWHIMLALFLGVLIGYLNLHSDEIQFPALLLLVLGFFIGFSHPHDAWVFALLLAMWIPIGQFLSTYFYDRTDRFVQEGILSLIAFVPAFAGTYAGVAVRWAVKHFNSTADIHS